MTQPADEQKSESTPMPSSVSATVQHDATRDAWRRGEGRIAGLGTRRQFAPRSGFRLEVVAALNSGTQLQVIERTADGIWWHVVGPNSPKVQGWLHRSVLERTRVAEAMRTVPVSSLPSSSFTPAPKPTAAPVPSPQKTQTAWQLVADSTLDFPGGQDRNHWYYLWTPGRNNFDWQPMAQINSGACYRDPNGSNLEICPDSIKTDSRGDVGLQWKASRGGTYRFEWDSPSLRFYKHASLVGSQGKGAELPFSATIEGVIDWEMFFWVATADTPYHVRVYRLQQ